jgi:hypothetical protein
MTENWWNDQSGQTDYDPTQTATGPDLLTPTTYSPPGQNSPADQYNYVPDPNAPGGYQTYAPGQMAPPDLPSFSNNTGQYPNDQEMAQSVVSNIDLSPTVDAQGNAQFMSQYMANNGFASLPQDQQQTWVGQYGPNAAQYQYGLQSGQYQLPAGTEGFLNLPPNEQEIWYGTYGADAPMKWAQESMLVGQAQGGGTGNPFYGNYPTNQGGGTVAPSSWAQEPGPYNPQTGRHPGWGTIGAGTAGIQYGYGVPGFGQAQQQILPGNLPYLSDPRLAPGYIPGSGTYNQFNLSTGQLFGPIGPNNVMSNLNYGVGGPGDPTTGLEQQTPQQWVQGGKLFNWQGNMGTAANGTQGLDYIATLFGRSDTPSGIGTPTWSAPQQYWDGLAQAIGQGKVQPTNRGWALMVSRNVTPQSLGAAAVQQAASVGVGPNGQGANAGGGGGTAGGGGTPTGPMGPGSEVFNQAQAYQQYLTARMNNLEIPGMNMQDQRFHDQLAFDQAKQAWLEQYQKQQAEEAKRQFDVTSGVAQGQLTGTYNGAPTLAAQQLQQNTSLGYLNLLAQMRGPSDIFQYLKVLQGTPGGIKDIVNAASGAYRMPQTGGGNINVGTTGADINSLVNQMNDPNYGQEGQNLTLPRPNQINAQALLRMSPSQQQTLLAAYEAAGYNPQDVMAIFQNSLPQYAGARQAGGQVGRVALLGR